MLIPQDMTEEELAKSNEELRILRFKLLREETEEQKAYNEAMRLKFLKEDKLKKS